MTKKSAGAGFDFNGERGHFREGQKFRSRRGRLPDQAVRVRGVARPAAGLPRIPPDLLGPAHQAAVGQVNVEREVHAAERGRNQLLCVFELTQRSTARQVAHRYRV